MGREGSARRIGRAMLQRPPAGTIPDAPGSYQFKDADGRVIYVGKAKSLRQRLSNYFQSPSALAHAVVVMDRGASGAPAALGCKAGGGTRVCFGPHRNFGRTNPFAAPQQIQHGLLFPSRRRASERPRQWCLHLFLSNNQCHRRTERPTQKAEWLFYPGPDFLWTQLQVPFPLVFDWLKRLDWL